MLEHEFGKKERPGDSGEPVVGSVDENGALITVGPKKRVGARWAQGILALATAVSSLYGALVGIVSIYPRVISYVSHPDHKDPDTGPTRFDSARHCSILNECSYLFLCFLSLCDSTVLRQAEQIYQP
jgi:hypothetical protein